MNADLVYMLCPHMDVGSMFALAAAVPVWSPMIHKYMKKEKLKVQLVLKCEANVETLNYVERGSMERDVVPKSIWKDVPSRVLDIDYLLINQSDRSAISEDVYALLAKITTSRLGVMFHCRGEVRKVLRTIHFRSPSYVELFEELRGTDKEPLLVHSDLTRFKRILYSLVTDRPDIHLLDAVDTERAIVRVSHSEEFNPMAQWLADLIEKASAARPYPLRCVRCSDEEFEIERVSVGDAPRSITRPRMIDVFVDAFRSTFEVENFFE